MLPSDVLDTVLNQDIDRIRRTLDETRVKYEDGTHKSLREHLDAQKNRQGPKP